MSDFMSAMKNTMLDGADNLTSTENGALGYKTTGKALLDLNFALSSLRNESEAEIWKRFFSAYNENPDLAVAWLFYSRDCRGGSGERRTFRVIFPRLASQNPSLAAQLLKFIPEYGRWDDLIYVIDKFSTPVVQKEGLTIIQAQWVKDMRALKSGEPVSIMAKWLPSEGASSKETKRLAHMIRGALCLTPRLYRKAVSALRKQIDVVERKMSANQWQDINYPGVPSKAMLNYRRAFLNHDEDGYTAYLEAVKKGEAKIHSGTLFPHEIVHAYNFGVNAPCSMTTDETLEEQWKALPNTIPAGSEALVVVDGSYSMTTTVAGSSVMALEVARAIGLYFAERLSGPYKDHFITFSFAPEMVYVNPELTLCGKLQHMWQYDDCSNTDIEKTFDLILKTAVKNHLQQDELPANILIISDMEFDDVAQGGSWYSNRKKIDQALFKTIAAKFDVYGYKLPRLVFWNVCSRTNSIPVRENELGVALVSGFSPSIADMVLSGKLDPWECLVDKLTSERYLPILQEVRSSYGHE